MPLIFLCFRAVSRASYSELPKSNSMTYYWWCYEKRSYNGDSGKKRLVFFGSFKNIVQVMASTENDLHEKILVIVSEGVKKNEIGEKEIDEMKELTNSKAIKVVSCYIAKNTSVESLTIYTPKNARYPYWEDQAKFLFDISSAVSSANIPLHILNDYNWQIDDSGNMENDKIKLFFSCKQSYKLRCGLHVCERTDNAKRLSAPFSEPYIPDRMHQSQSEKRVQAKKPRQHRRLLAICSIHGYIHDNKVN